MLKRIILIILIISTIISETKISNDIPIKNIEVNNKLIIEKLNISEKLFNINSKENTIEKHVEILKESIMPDKKDSIMILAAHSGTGKIAYFQELDKLEKNDIVILIYKNKKYTYFVKDIWEEKKNGYIHVNKEKKRQLVLTTCSPTKQKYQLIVNCIEKESN